VSGAGEPGSGEPAYLQIIRQIKNAFSTRVLKPGDRMPTVRNLARQVDLNPNTVARAYRELEREGLLEGRPGRGTFVKNTAPPLAVAQRRTRLYPFVQQLVAEGRLLGVSDTEIRRLVQSALREHRVRPQ
jgi:GntR family transcriptional regulator